MGKGKKEVQTTSGTREREIPAWLESGSQEAVATGQQINRREYEGFGGQRVADLSANEIQGQNMASDQAGAYQGYLQQGEAALQGMQDWTQADHGAYMNPYMEEVLNPQVRRRQRSYESTVAENRATAGMRGAFGGRQNVAEDLASKTHQEGLDDMYGTAYGAAYDRAQTAFGQDQNRRLGQAGAFTQMAGAETAGSSTSIKNLMSTGFAGRTQEQAEKDFEYGEFLEERDWDITNLQPLLQALGTVPYGETETYDETQTKEKKGGGLGQVIGLAATVIGGIYGGPMGAQAGAALGGAISG